MTTLGIMMMGASILLQQLQPAYAAVTEYGHTDRKAPIAASEENVYLAWWTNKTGNHEVMFRASTDGGTTFGDKINLSKTPQIRIQQE